MSLQSSLYISYDGMLEPLGQSQVLAYLKCLAHRQSIHIISFEKADDWVDTTEIERITGDLMGAGIQWHPLRYHKRPMVLATVWDIVRGMLFGIWLVLRYRLRIVHARSYVPSVMALGIKRITGAKYLFDMRGFWADEKVDGGSWQRDWYLYKLVKGFEKRFLLNADHVVSLTNAGLREINRFDYLQGCMPPITVIPTCADLARFKPLSHARHGRADGGFVMGYVGSVGTYYMFDEVVACFVQLLRMRPEARFLVVNRGQHSYIRDRLAAADLPEAAVELRSATHAEMPSQMARMDAGIFFIKPAFSKQASAPTKLAEFLGCGIPCIGNYGVGDMAQVLESEQVGIALTSFDTESFKVGLVRLLQLVDNPGTRDRCAASAKRHFSLDEGVTRYQGIYDLLSR